MTRRWVGLLGALLAITTLTGCGGKPEPPGVTFAGGFIDAMSGLYDQGAQYDAEGLPRVADHLYGLAAAGTSSLRYTVDVLLSRAGTGTSLDAVVGDRLGDWDAIAALGYGSPYPFLFQGFAAEANGASDEAKDLYHKATLNPGLFENSEKLKTILLLDEPALTTLKTRLVALEDKILAAYTPGPAIPRSEYAFSDAWLRAQARLAAEQSPDDPDAALAYAETAVNVNPYDGLNYAGAAMVALYMGDAGTVVAYLNDGLLVDPENQALQQLATTVKGALQ